MASCARQTGRTQADLRPSSDSRIRRWLAAERAQPAASAGRGHLHKLRRTAPPSAPKLVRWPNCRTP